LQLRTPGVHAQQIQNVIAHWFGTDLIDHRFDFDASLFVGASNLGVSSEGSMFAICIQAALRVATHFYDRVRQLAPSLISLSSTDGAGGDSEETTRGATRCAIASCTACSAGGVSEETTQGATRCATPRHLITRRFERTFVVPFLPATFRARSSLVLSRAVSILWVIHYS